jgi:protein-S-isoprenylcysteine O-methyltransferase Ste14
MKKFLQNYITEIVLIWLAVLFYFYCPFYKTFLPPIVKHILLLLALAYSVIAIPWHIYLTKKNRDSKGFLFFKAFQNLIQSFLKYIARFTSDTSITKTNITAEERTILLFSLVKFIFIPLMLKFAHANFTSVKSRLAEILVSSNPLHELLVNNYFLLVVSLLFLIDTAFYTFGYIFESSLLKNKIRSVDCTFLGWFVALACYPPFNKVTSMFFPLNEKFTTTFGNETITIIARIVIILLLLIFASSSVSLGTKCSNLTNRGIVTRGTYRIVRHPAYMSKIMIWWILLIPFIPGHFTIVFSLLAWTMIYFMRAITEEMHLSKDPDYILYCRQTKYRFIPGIY